MLNTMEWHRIIKKKHRFLKGENKMINMRNLKCKKIKLLKKGLNCKLMTLDYKWSQLKTNMK
jgi:hypothetical protein